MNMQHYWNTFSAEFMQCAASAQHLPLRGGSFCSSRFFVMLKREEFCRLSFLMWGGPVNFNFDICVGGGCSVVLFCVCAFFFACQNSSSMFKFKNLSKSHCN